MKRRHFLQAITMALFTQKSVAQECQPTQDVFVPGIYLKALEVAYAKATHENHDVKNYTTHVVDNCDYLAVIFYSNDDPFLNRNRTEEPKTICFGNCGTHIGFTVQINKSDNTLKKFYYNK